MADQELVRQFQLPDFFKFRPGHLCDPPPWFIRELDRDVLRELAINEIQMHKDILEAQVRASERSLEILQKMG